MPIKNDNKTMPIKSPTLPERIKQFREQKGLTQEEFASVLSTTKASITRWEAGASRPSKLAAKALEDIGFGVIEEHETNKDSLSRLDYLSEKELMRGVVKTIKFGKKREKIVPTPYVINGPENQLDFFSKLVKLQERPGDIEVSDSYIKKLSIVKEVRGIPTAQFNNVNCYRGWEGNVPIAGVKATYGYRFVGNVNAKNSFGGYTGYSPFSGIVRDDGYGARVVRYCMVSSTDEYGICLSQMVY